MRSTRLSHFLDFYGNAHDSRFAGSSPNVRLSRFVISRARRRRRRRSPVSLGSEERCASARKICETRARRRRSIRPGGARARAIFFPRVPRRNTFQEKEGREKEVKFLLDRRNRPQCANAFDARSKTQRARAFTRTRKTRTHPSTRPFLPRRTSVTSSNTETHHHRRHRA